MVGETGAGLGFWAGVGQAEFGPGSLGWIGMTGPNRAHHRKVFHPYQQQRQIASKKRGERRLEPSTPQMAKWETTHGNKSPAGSSFFASLGCARPSTIWDLILIVGQLNPQTFSSCAHKHVRIPSN